MSLGYERQLVSHGSFNPCRPQGQGPAQPGGWEGGPKARLSRLLQNHVRDRLFFPFLMAFSTE